MDDVVRRPLCARRSGGKKGGGRRRGRKLNPRLPLGGQEEAIDPRLAVVGRFFREGGINSSAILMTMEQGLSVEVTRGPPSPEQLPWKIDCAFRSRRGASRRREEKKPCEKTYCAWGAACVVSESGKALCQCPPDCPTTSEPVCGSDDVTYTNYCHLRQASCHKRKNTRVKHQGACGK
ncbi:hypothetical protein KM043_012470 [Ampulex compressa]|nr:hypothetical protein KM043_012470 [Ampulex compressa]